MNLKDIERVQGTITCGPYTWNALHTSVTDGSGMDQDLYLVEGVAEVYEKEDMEYISKCPMMIGWLIKRVKELEKENKLMFLAIQDHAHNNKVLENVKNNIICLDTNKDPSECICGKCREVIDCSVKKCPHCGARFV